MSPMTESVFEDDMLMQKLLYGELRSRGARFTIEIAT